MVIGKRVLILQQEQKEWKIKRYDENSRVSLLG
jgi:hypothetical protein